MGVVQETISACNADATAVFAGAAGIRPQAIVLDDPGSFGLHDLNRVVAAARLTKVHDGVFAIVPLEGAKTNRLVIRFQPVQAGFRMDAEAHDAEDIAAAASGNVIGHPLG